MDNNPRPMNAATHHNYRISDGLYLGMGVIPKKRFSLLLEYKEDHSLD